MGPTHGLPKLHRHIHIPVHLHKSASSGKHASLERLTEMPAQLEHEAHSSLVNNPTA